ncbi:hypothetical protein [Deinococcus peraridilitoris]|uniref:Golgi phosphoprotein 3 (GPP34) n=1 Tax=Deinococcus peraridilitoris (strain DSM 19664 / LMG 22246 / CIP 109416 / KR-200) TaxID=937777 RepID=L0A3T4_DEIPD|nr:hypothetical protein [Deinococcus peraridilitoris]AFZ67660.1 hypothetical protein Deipe_2174 [Deinococcus peraridilitoris DSM 19664]
MTATGTTTVPLTLSEGVLLHGEQFAKKLGAVSIGDVQVDLPLVPDKVSSNELARVLLATALLELEACGSLKLAMQHRKTLFGLRKVSVLELSAGLSHEVLPEGSLEARILQAVQQLNRASDLPDLIALLVPLSHQPRLDVVNFVKEALARRDLLEVQNTKMLGLLPVRKYTATKVTLAYTAYASPQLARDRLTACETQRPEVWRALVRGIETGLDRQTKSNDSSLD